MHKIFLTNVYVQAYNEVPELKAPQGYKTSDQKPTVNIVINL